MEFDKINDLSADDVDFQLSRFISTVKKYSWVILGLENIDESSLDLNLISNQTYTPNFRNSLTTANVFQTRYPVTDREYAINKITDPNTFKIISTIRSGKKKVRVFTVNDSVIYSDVVGFDNGVNGVIEYNRTSVDWNVTRDSLTENMFNYLMNHGLDGITLVDIDYKISLMLDNGKYVFGEVKYIDNDLRGKTIDDHVFV